MKEKGPPVSMGVSHPSGGVVVLSVYLSIVLHSCRGNYMYRVL